MIGFIMAGGYGSRLYPLTLAELNKASRMNGIPEDVFNINALPKPLAPIANSSMIYSSINMLERLGIHNIAIQTGYLRDRFSPVFGGTNGISLQWDPGSHGSVNSITSFVLRGTDIDHVVVLSGDIVSNIDAGPALEAHIKSGAAATIVTTPITPNVHTCSPIATKDLNLYSSAVVDYRHKYPVSRALGISNAKINRVSTTR